MARYVVFYPHQSAGHDLTHSLTSAHAATHNMPSTAAPSAATSAIKIAVLSVVASYGFGVVSDYLAAYYAGLAVQYPQLTYDE